MFSKQCRRGGHTTGVMSFARIERVVRRRIVFWEKCVQIWEKIETATPKNLDK